MGGRLRATALGAALCIAAAPSGATAAAPASVSAVPDLGAGVSVSRLPAGGVAIVSPATGAPVAAVELWYRAPSIGFGVKAQPSLARVAAQTVAASKPLVGDTLGKTVQKDRMDLFIRTIGIARATTKIGMANIV